MNEADLSLFLSKDTKNILKKEKIAFEITLNSL